MADEVKSVESAASWTFLTNHAHVLVCLSGDGDQTLREIALRIGITERAVQRIIADLEAAAIITREKEGRRNRYQINSQVRLRHDLEAHKTVGDLMEMVRAV
jgi:DNA-binding MarR family transcriptional regulator